MPPGPAKRPVIHRLPGAEAPNVSPSQRNGGESQRPTARAGSPSRDPNKPRKSSGTPQASQRRSNGALPSNRPAKKKEMSTAEKLDELDQLRREKSKAYWASQKKKSKPKGPTLPPVISLEKLAPIAETVAPLQAIDL